ncbi:hypothetical protein A2U01_0094285, partial [Trifolium medium]|nr:hypothetical protein [Trifolium medium]
MNIVDIDRICGWIRINHDGGMATGVGTSTSNDEEEAMRSRAQKNSDTIMKLSTVEDNKLIVECK